MRKYSFSFVFLLCFSTSIQSQTIQQRLAQAVKTFESDPQMRNAITSIYVADAITGKKVYGHNENFGLAPASTQKIFTSVAALELLGAGYRYKTDIAYSGKIENGSLNGQLFILSNGDPSLGSWRYNDTKEEILLTNWVKAIKAQNINNIGQGIFAIANNKSWSPATIPDGWIWQDIGNYYGAGAGYLNWRENQYDLVMRSGSKTGDSVQIVTTRPRLYSATLKSYVTAGPPNSGDNAYIYLPPFATTGIVRGTIPPNEKEFVISGSFPNPSLQLSMTLADKLRENQVAVKPFSNDATTVNTAALKIIATHNSPRLDSMNFHFMRRSINLYGEAFVKTIALEKEGKADTETGIEIVRDFLNAIGIEKSALQMIDGSGLSPQNRVTTFAEVKALQYARSRPWYQAFYQSLPEYNGMKMKSGSIGGARAYAGYHKSKDGKQYVFSIIVNNYDGSAAAVVRKMYKVLDILK